MAPTPSNATIITETAADRSDTDHAANFRAHLTSAGQKCSPYNPSGGAGGVTCRRGGGLSLYLSVNNLLDRARLTRPSMLCEVLRNSFFFGSFHSRQGDLSFFSWRRIFIQLPLNTPTFLLI